MSILALVLYFTCSGLYVILQRLDKSVIPIHHNYEFSVITVPIP